ncbi:MAG: Rrf2 family transcriptional regulator [Clostridia bacterium]|nr:Rrf2 family transcriptional regulator [Clostridia bacterium]
MKISAAGRYGVRIMVDIAKNEGYTSLNDVAKNQGISLKYAEQIAGKLLRKGLIVSQRGQDGGYRLAAPACHTNIKDILEATGDITPQISCDINCPRKSDCVGGDVWSTLNILINDYLSGVTIKDLLTKGN